jgi:hypothetical protein
MATRINKSRVLFLVLVLAVAASLTFLYVFRGSQPIATTSVATCTPLPSNMRLVGSAKAISEIESASPAVIQTFPEGVPRVPFGEMNDYWKDLKRSVEPGDLIYQYSTGISGGYVVLRQKCLVGQLSTWVS